MEREWDATVENRVGRLLEVRVRALRTVQGTAAYEDLLRSRAAEIPGRIVACVDCRELDVFAPDVAAAVITLFSRTNAKIERSALLLPSNRATFALQIERVVREGKNPDRRSFRKKAELSAWVASALTSPERERLASFLGDGS